MNLLNFLDASTVVVEVTDKEMFALRSHYPIIFVGDISERMPNPPALVKNPSPAFIYALAHNWKEIELPGSTTDGVLKRWTMYSLTEPAIHAFLAELRSANMLRSLRNEPTEEE